MWNSIPWSRRGRRRAAPRLSWLALGASAAVACAVYDEALLTPQRGSGAGGYAGAAGAGGKGGCSITGGSGAGPDAGGSGEAPGEGGIGQTTGGQTTSGGHFGLGGRGGAASTDTGGTLSGGASGGAVAGGSGGSGAGGGSSGGTVAEGGAAGVGGSGDTCVDGQINGSETGSDCGGDCPACPLGQPCAVDGDCQSAHCIGKVCAVVDCTDELRNGRETDVDCGGADCPKCAATKACSAASDCVTGVCATSLCVYPRTCGEIKTLTPASADGLYMIDPDGAAGANAAFSAYCDMTSASGGWTRVGYEPAGAGGAQINGALNRLGVSVGTTANVANKSAAGLFGLRFNGLYTELRITWGANYAQMTVSAGIFVDAAAPALPVSKVTSSSTTLTGWLGSSAAFCRASSSAFRPGDTSWALVPSNNPDTTCGCNGMSWSGNGIYYGGSSPADVCTAWGGGFAGLRAVGEQKGGIASATELVLWVR